MSSPLAVSMMMGTVLQARTFSRHQAGFRAPGIMGSIRLRIVLPAQDFLRLLPKSGTLRTFRPSALRYSVSSSVSGHRRLQVIRSSWCFLFRKGMPRPVFGRGVALFDGFYLPTAAMFFDSVFPLCGLLFCNVLHGLTFRAVSVSHAAQIIAEFASDDGTAAGLQSLSSSGVAIIR